MAALAQPSRAAAEAEAMFPTARPRLDVAMYLQLQTLVRPALEHLRVRRWMAAATLLGQANAVLEQDPAKLWDWRVYVLPPYGVALLELGQVAQARAVLLQAREAEQRLAAGEGHPSLQQLLQAQAGGFSRMLLATEFKRQLFDAVAAAGRPRAHALQTLLFDGKAGAHASLLPLARAHAMADDAAALVALYRSLPPLAAGGHGPDAGDEPARDERAARRFVPPVGEEYARFSFGVLLAAQGQPALASQALDEALALNWQRLRWQGSWVPSTAAHAAAFGIRRHQLSAALSVAWQRPLPPARARELVARIVESKGLGVRHAERLRLLLARQDEPVLAAVRRELQQQEDRLAQQLSSARPRAGAAPGAADADVASAEREAVLALLEASAGESLALGVALPALRQAGLGAVFVPGERLIAAAQAAQPDAAFIGYFVHARLAADGRGFAERRYARYTLAGDDLSLVDLGSQHEIDALLGRWRTAAMARRDAALVPSGRALREALLVDLPSAVLARRRWIIDPDGPLALLPFEALPGHAAPALLDERCISQVTSLASLAVDGDLPAADGEARVIADPAYPATGAATFEDRGDSRAPSRRPRPAALPETRREAEAVAAAWARMGVAARRYVGGQAGRAALPSSGPAPRYLHVAAHGLLLQALDDDEELRAPVDILLPGRRAALALAQDGQLQLVTASELQRLWLHGTELVVLSACDTGNGDATAGEGVDSLRRAVEVAGARASISAVWPVPSHATVALMERFYRTLSDGERPAEALRTAKLDVRQRHGAPLDWAGFVLAGQG